MFNCIDTSHPSRYLYINPNKVEAKYTGQGHHANDIGVVLSEKGVWEYENFFYFEVEIVNRGVRGEISVGVVDYMPSSSCTDDGKSYGYGGRVGCKVYLDSKHHEYSEQSYGPKYSQGDIVGCGITFTNNSLFFTLNGVLLGEAFDLSSTGLHDFRPFVSMHSNGEAIRINYGGGGERGFMYDIKKHVEEDKVAMSRDINDMDDIDPSTIHSLVENYMLHHGLSDSLAAFKRSHKIQSECGANESKEEEFFRTRAHIKSLIITGDIDGAMEKIDAYLSDPRYHKENVEIQLLLQCQKLCDLVAQGATQAALKFIQSHLSGYKFERGSSKDKMLCHYLSLLAFREPRKEPLVQVLLDKEHRFHTASSVNSILIRCFTDQGCSKLPDHSNLDILVKHLTATVCQLQRMRFDDILGVRFIRSTAPI